MKIAIILLALVAASLGFHLRSSRRFHPPAPRTEVSSDPSGEFTEPPKRLTLPELFTFPGSKFVEDILVMMILRPLPKDPSFIGEVSNPKVDELESTMIELHEKFGRWTGIPTMITMKMTKWLAENMFACPAVVYDNIFVNVIETSIGNAFSSLRGTMAGHLRAVTLEVFPDLEDEERNDMVADATQEVFKWIREELRDNFLAHILKDAATFSHTFYDALVDKVESFNGENIPTGFLKGVLDASLSSSEIQCESAKENDDKWKQGIQALTQKLKMHGTRYWMVKLEEYFMDQMPMMKRKDFAIDGDHLENTAKEIASFIPEFLKIVGEENEKMESTADLENFLVQALGEDYSNLIKVLLEKMGLAEQAMSTRTEVSSDPSGEFTEPPKRLTMPEMFTFPGSKFVEDILVVMMLRPLPKDPSFIGEVSDPKVEELESTMIELNEKFGKWTGIPTMITMKMTKWLAENIFACPAVVYDKIFINVIQTSLGNAFSSLRGTMASNLRAVTLEVFPDLEDEERNEMVADATQEVFKWIREELRDNFLAQVIRDAAVFSHTFYETLVEKVESFDGENIPTGFLKTVLDASLSSSEVVCESAMENDDHFKQGIQALTKKLEMHGTRYWIVKLEEYFMDQMPMMKRKDFTIDGDHLENTAKEIASFILEFLKIVGEENEKMESTADLENFLLQALGEDYSNLITVLLEKMGLTKQEMPSERFERIQMQRRTFKNNWLF